MAITTVDGLLAGFKPPSFFMKALTGTTVAGRLVTPLFLAGIPGVGAMPTPGLAGAALTSLTGQLPFTNPPGGQETRLARFAASNSAATGTLHLYDMLWSNSGFTITSTGAQTVNSAAWPARDVNGTTNGDGVMLAVLVSAATGAGTPTITVSYTNSAGTAGRTATNILATSASSPLGTVYLIGLQAGDVGVRSVQTLTLSATWTSGTINLIAIRQLASVVMLGAGVSAPVDALTSGMPRLYDNTVPFLVYEPTTTTTTSIGGMVSYAQG